MESYPASEDTEVRDYLVERGLYASEIPKDWGALPRGKVKQAQLALTIIEMIGEEGFRNCTINNENFSPARKDVGPFVWGDHRLCIPWRDRSGLVAGIQRRIVSPELEQRARTAKRTVPKYVMGRGGNAAMPYGWLGAEGNTGSLWIVEGALDQLAVMALEDDKEARCIGLFGKKWKKEYSWIAKGRRVFVALDEDVDPEFLKGIAYDCFKGGAKEVERTLPERGDWSDLLYRQRGKS